MATGAPGLLEPAVSLLPGKGQGKGNLGREFSVFRDFATTVELAGLWFDGADCHGFRLARLAQPLVAGD